MAAAITLNVSPALLKKWRGKGEGPRFLVLGERLVRYSAEDLQAYLETLKRKSCTAGDIATPLCGVDPASQCTAEEKETVR